MLAADSEFYYDPYDFEIDADPYPVWKRLRDDKPLYHNEKYDFYAVSRYTDVRTALLDWRTYSSARGTVLEILKANITLPPGLFIFEDPPAHDLHRGILARLFAPKQMAMLEEKIRRFCAQCLDPFVGTDGFDFIANIGAEMPMRTIGMLLGVPESDQRAIRDRTDSGLKLESGEMPEISGLYEAGASSHSGDFSSYLDFRAEHPSDDLMTELLYAEFEDETGTLRRLSREEILGYIGLLSGAGNETTTRLIGWAGKVLADHPDQLRELAADPSLVPNAIEELLRFEPPSPVQARYVTRDVEFYGQTVTEGSAMLLLNASGNRDERHFDDPDRFDIHRKIDHHLTFGYGIHFCMGSALARLEGRIALEEILKRFPFWQVDHDAARQARTSTVRGWDALPVLV